MIIIITITMLVLKFNLYFLFVAIGWLLLCINTIVIAFSLADIKITEEVLILEKIFSKKEINLSGLKVYDITIVRYPYFLMETSVGNLKINYTNYNRQQILVLLRRNNPNRIELFELTVRHYFLSPFSS